MKRIIYILSAAVLVLAGCRKVELEVPVHIGQQDEAKVPITFSIAVPIDDLSTRAMGNNPDVQNIYVAVFGGSGYFNEWVPAEVGTQYASENEVVYELKMRLSMSDSRLRLHIIANSPVGEPPITGVSTEDTEDIVMSKLRSQIGDGINDAYWQKIILPYGIKAKTIITNGVEQYELDENGNRIPTVQTVEQFTKHHNPIPLVRNFARIRLIKDATLTDVQIDKFCLAYAPSEGPVAPILSGMYYSDVWGDPVDGESDYKETFFINYQKYPLESEDETVVKLSDAPFNYRGYSPADLALGTYPENESGMQEWSSETQESNYLYVYERAKPRTGQKATRIIIHAKKGNEDWKFYPLDIVDTTSAPAPLLRNFTYTVTLTQLAEGTGETTIAKAADATAANVSADPKTQDLNEVSDGVALIAVSYIDATYIKSSTYDLMFHFEPLLGTEGNDKVSLKVGYNNGTDGFVENATSANGSAFASTPTIEKSNGVLVLYVKSGNNYVEATASQIADTSIEKWGKIQYTTVGTDGSAFNKSYTQTIRVEGTKNDNTKIYRDVQINLIPKRTLKVECLDKFIEETEGAIEHVRVYIPEDLTRSMFPLQFKIESDESTLNPVTGQNLPVNSGESLTGDGSTTYFFIKNLTRDEYDTLSTASVNGVTMKYFDCSFKSIVDASACSIYVGNDYFVTDSDDFDNYTKRLFTGTSLSSEVNPGGYVNLSFTMDAAHSSAQSTVFDEGSSSQRVLPSVVTITLTGLEPQRENDGTIADRWLTRVSNGVYSYTVTETANVSPTLHLVGSSSSDTYSVTLSTDSISPNPDLYAPVTISGEIVKSKITNTHFEDASRNTITNVLALAGQTVYFCFTYGGTQVPVAFKLNGLEPDDSHVSGSGTYTYTPSSAGAQRIALKTTAASMDAVSLTDLTVTSDSYNQPSPNAFSLSRFLYSFSGGFTNAAGSSPVTYVKTSTGADVYFTLTYESDPVPVSFSLTGLEPAAGQTGLEVNDGVYTYTPSGTSGTQIIHFVTTDAQTTCVLSGLTPSSDAYAAPDPAEFSLERRSRRWVTGSYTIDLSDSDTYTTEPQNVVFSNVDTNYDRSYDYDNWQWVYYYYKSMGTRTGGQGNRRYYNGSFLVKAPTSLTDSRITGIEMSYYSSWGTTYNSQSVTVVGDVTASSTLTDNKTSWSSSSTGDGNGDSTVTVTMSCTDGTQYNNRNRLTSITVYYGYWDEE